MQPYSSKNLAYPNFLNRSLIPHLKSQKTCIYNKHQFCLDGSVFVYYYIYLLFIWGGKDFERYHMTDWKLVHCEKGVCLIIMNTSVFNIFNSL